MTKEQIEFLNNLKKEILTQDNLATRDVMFAVMETKRQFNIDKDCCDDEVLIIDDCVCDNINEVIDYYPNLEEELKNLDLESAYYLLKVHGYNVRLSGTTETKEFDFNNGQSVFFTAKACKEFIKNNKHNLSLPACYGISSWNNPEMNALREIIISNDWEKLELGGKYLLRKNNINMLLGAIKNCEEDALTDLQEEILSNLVWENSDNFNFEDIIDIARNIADFGFYNALFETEIITDYFKKVDPQKILDWVKENNQLEEYKEYADLTDDDSDIESLLILMLMITYLKYQKQLSKSIEWIKTFLSKVENLLNY